MKKFLFFSFIVATLILGIWYVDQVPPMPTTCVFCKPEVIQSHIFYEDELVKCLLTHKPVYPGHSLIIPRRHVERFEDLTMEEISRMMAMIKKVHEANQRLHGECAYFLLQKNGREVGQTVPHVHFHYIPRELGYYSSLPIMWNMFIAGHWSRPLSHEVLQKEAKIVQGALGV